MVDNKCCKQTPGLPDAKSHCLRVAVGTSAFLHVLKAGHRRHRCEDLACCVNGTAIMTCRYGNRGSCNACNLKVQVPLVSRTLEICVLTFTLSFRSGPELPVSSSACALSLYVRPNLDEPGHRFLLSQARIQASHSHVEHVQHGCYAESTSCVPLLA